MQIKFSFEHHILERQIRDFEISSRYACINFNLAKRVKVIRLTFRFILFFYLFFFSLVFFFSSSFYLLSLNSGTKYNNRMNGNNPWVDCELTTSTLRTIETARASYTAVS